MTVIGLVWASDSLACDFCRPPSVVVAAASVPRPWCTDLVGVVASVHISSGSAARSVAPGATCHVTLVETSVVATAARVPSTSSGVCVASVLMSAAVAAVGSSIALVVG